MTLADGSATEVEIAAVRPHKGRLIVALAGVASVAAAERYIGSTLRADRNRVVAELDEGEFLDADLIGLELIDSAGRRLGAVKAVEHYPSSAMLVVGEQRALVPFVAAFIKRVDRAQRLIDVELPAGLLEGDADLA